MDRKQKVRLGILFGGRSGEHEVSLISAASVISALDPEEFEITAIGITKAGKIASALELQSMLPKQLLSQVQCNPVLEANNSGMRVTSSLLLKGSEMGSAPQIIFPLLHGPYGEDGTIQGLLEIAGLPYIGCGVLASAVGMDKDVMKRLFMQAQLPVIPFRTVFTRDLKENIGDIKKLLEVELGYPMFSKPANLGSSVGICKIRDEKEFDEAVHFSAQFDRKILIEKGIDGRELECAILGNDEPKASVVGEVFSAHEFYDYEAKYVNPDSKLEIPAKISDKKAEEIRDIALMSFKVIDGAGLARVDFFLERNTGKIWLNEINTMPGFTPISMYTKLWAASGVPFDELVRHLVYLGEEKSLEKSKLRISVN
jgi:D-alanine-D-alanine ligase